MGSCFLALKGAKFKAMKVIDAGGEFELLRRLSELNYFPKEAQGVVVPVGDDAAVIEPLTGRGVLTVDTIVEGRHFDRRYFSAQQIGSRAIEGAVSDIVAMGGIPRYVLCALVLPQNISVEEIEALYFGISKSLKRVGAVLVGGDTNSGSENLSISVTVVGEIPTGGRIIKRSGAHDGEIVCVTGALGGSGAGLMLLSREVSGYDHVKEYHLEPRCRLDVVEILQSVATAAIDISDGLSSELQHLSIHGKCGFEIDFEKIPAKPGVKDSANILGFDYGNFILNGGEEFEILFTVPPDLISLVEGLATPIGRVIKEPGAVLIRNGGRAPLLAGGFVHLR